MILNSVWQGVEVHRKTPMIDCIGSQSIPLFVISPALAELNNRGFLLDAKTSGHSVALTFSRHSPIDLLKKCEEEMNEVSWNWFLRVK